MTLNSYLMSADELFHDPHSTTNVADSWITNEDQYKYMKHFRLETESFYHCLSKDAGVWFLLFIAAIEGEI